MNERQFQTALEGLTRRQRDVLARVLRAENDSEIAKALFIEPSTVRKHVEAICKAFGLKNQPGEHYSKREELIHLFYQYRSDIIRTDFPLTSSLETKRQQEEQPSSVQNCVAYDAAWVGRKELLDALLARVSGSCRILVLAGITGIGKTALAERLCTELMSNNQNSCYLFFRKNFDHKLAPLDFTSVATAWLEEWGESPSSKELREPEQLLHKVVNGFCRQKKLVLLDSLEALLLGDEETGWNAFADRFWEIFFISLLSAEFCESRFIVTTQDVPASLVETASRYQNFWYCQPLVGLDVTEQIELFAKVGLSLLPSIKALLQRIGQAYCGHPLALRTIVGEIVHDFQSDVAAYWQQYGAEIEEVERALSEAEQGKVSSSEDAWKLDRYSIALRRGVKSRLEQTFQRLEQNAPQAYILLCTAAVYRCPVKQSWWLRHLLYRGYDPEQQQVAFQALRDRYLVELTVDPIQGLLAGQHNLVRSVALSHRERLG